MTNPEIIWDISTKKDDADNDSSGVLEEGVVEDAGGEGGDIEDGVNQPGVTPTLQLQGRQQHQGIIHDDDDLMTMMI